MATLLNLIDHLPRNSYLVEAQAEDEELADLLASGSEEGAGPTQRIAEWSPQMEALAAVVDRLADVASILVTASGGRAPHLDRYPRPVTAVDRARSERRLRRHRDLVNRVLPRREG